MSERGASIFFLMGAVLSVAIATIKGEPFWLLVGMGCWLGGGCLSLKLIDDEDDE